MKEKIDIENWKRREHYLFFKTFDEQFHGVSVRMNMTTFLKNCHSLNLHKSSSYFHKCMRAINDTKAFKLRMEENDVILYDRIDFGMTVLKEDQTFVYSYTEYHPDYSIFSSRMKTEFEAAKQSKKLRRKSTNHVIHGSILPWIDFTSLSHARNFKRKDSAPKITFGKISRENDRYFMPLSVHVNHCLVDGIDLGHFINLYQSYLDEK